MTKAEVVLWKALKEANRHGYNFRRQHPIGPYIADFASALDRLVIEVDGGPMAATRRFVMMRGAMRICERVDAE